jgi:hypothetical protein
MLLNGARRGGATAGSGVRNMAGTGAPTHSDGARGTYPQLEDEIKPRRRRALKGLLWVVVVIALAGVAAAWLGAKATNIGNDLTAAAQLIEPLKAQIESDDKDGAIATVSQLRSHTSAAKEAAGDPLWTLASSIPGLGSNFSAVAEVARSADDVASLSLAPLVNVFDTLDWNTLLPDSSGTNLAPLQNAAPTVSSAAHVVRVSAERLDQIDDRNLLPQVSEPLAKAKIQLNGVTGALDAAADAAALAPGMLGVDVPRNYLLIVQNNAESRASGGIPGALAVLTLDKGKLTLGAQSSASQVGIMDPVLPIDSEQAAIYTGRLGKFMQDTNLTPDFPTAASLAQAMWERKTGQRVDGVISLDPVALGFILDATGPVQLSNPELLKIASLGLPTELRGDNVVQTLLSDVYAKIDEPKLQDAYFAGVAQQIFSALSNGQSHAKSLIEGITHGVQEGRVLAWSGSADEQNILAKYLVSGSTTGPSVSPAQFGVYFNDGTGAKMDFYARRSVQLIKECPKDGYEQTTVRVTTTNTAPADAAAALPGYVTGDGIYGVPPGSVQTNIVAYGPVQANIESAMLDGHKTSFAPYLHSNRPVGILAVRLAPGESRTIDFTFGKIVQHTEPNVVVTPGVQSVKDVTLPSQIATCG